MGLEKFRVWKICEQTVISISQYYVYANHSSASFILTSTNHIVSNSDIHLLSYSESRPTDNNGEAKINHTKVRGAQEKKLLFHQ